MKKRDKKKKEIITKAVVYEQLQLDAIEGKLTNNFKFFERKVRRWYSKNFSTPLHETFNLAWDDILLHYYESALEDRDYNEIYEAAIEYIPELQRAREEEDEELNRELEAEQEETLARKRQREEASGSKGEVGHNKVEENGSVQGETSKDTQETKERASEKARNSRGGAGVSEGVPEEQSLKNKPQELNLSFEDEDPEES